MGRSTPDWQETLFDSSGDQTAQVLKASPGYLKYLHAINANTVDIYVQFFDAAVADVTVGTTTPKWSLLVPAGNGAQGGIFDEQWQDPVSFGTAISYACTTTATGAGAPTTGLTLNFGFI